MTANYWRTGRRGIGSAKKSMRRGFFCLVLVVAVLVLMFGSSVPNWSAAADADDDLEECLDEAEEEYQDCLDEWEDTLGDDADTICAPLLSTLEAACWAAYGDATG